MQGLRTKENNKFLKFFSIVQEKAKEQNSVFFMDFGQCDDIDFKDMELDTLFGWLIPNDKVDNFERVYLTSKVDDRWNDFCVWVTPNIENDHISVTFE